MAMLRIEGWEKPKKNGTQEEKTRKAAGLRKATDVHLQSEPVELDESGKGKVQGHRGQFRHLELGHQHSGTTD